MRARPLVAALAVARGCSAANVFDYKIPSKGEERELFWVHAPRTGATLRRYLLHAACPGRDKLLRSGKPPRKRDAYVGGKVSKGPWTRPACLYNYDVDSLFEHLPLPPGGAVRHLAVIFVREPARWVVSSFWSGVARPGLSALPPLLRHRPDALVPWPGEPPKTLEDRQALLKASITALGRTPNPLRAYAGLVANCTAKMLTGTPCLAAGVADGGRAVATLRAAAFVGVHERFADSLLLLARTFDLPATPAKMPRPSAPERSRRPAAYGDADLAEGLRDLKLWRSLDQDVYDAGAALFDERYRRSGEDLVAEYLAMPE